jgi:putative membrane protein
VRDDSVVEARGHHEQITSRGRSTVVRDERRVDGAGHRHHRAVGHHPRSRVLPRKSSWSRRAPAVWAEVEMGELGAKKATNGQVKAFAKHVVEDHTKANQELVTASKGKGVQVPSSRTALHKATIEKFQQQEAGKSFDRDYMEQMVEDHKAAVELFETAADDEKLDLDLRTYAKRVLPTLRDHLKQAQAIQSKLAG